MTITMGSHLINAAKLSNHWGPPLMTLRLILNNDGTGQLWIQFEPGGMYAEVFH